MSVGDFPESLSRAVLVGTMSVGRLGVLIGIFRCPYLGAPSLEAYMSIYCLNKAIHVYIYIYIYMYIYIYII